MKIIRKKNKFFFFLGGFCVKKSGIARFSRKYPIQIEKSIACVISHANVYENALQFDFLEEQRTKIPHRKYDGKIPHRIQYEIDMQSARFENLQSFL